MKKAPKKYLPRLNKERIIQLSFIAVFVYLVICLIYPFVALKEIKLPKITKETIKEEKSDSLKEIKPLESYMEGLEGKTVFRSLGPAPSAAPVVTAGPASIATGDLVKDFTLVGILTGETPQAIIEDKKTQKTYYVSKGQSVGDFQIEDIQEGKVILDYLGKKFELSL